MRTETIINFTNDIQKDEFDIYVSAICNILYLEEDNLSEETLSKFKIAMASLCLCYQIKFMNYLDIELQKPIKERELPQEIHQKIMKDFTEDYLNSINNMKKMIAKKLAEIDSEPKKEEQDNEPQRPKKQ